MPHTAPSGQWRAASGAAGRTRFHGTEESGGAVQEVCITQISVVTAHGSAMRGDRGMSRLSTVFVLSQVFPWIASGAKACGRESVSPLRDLLEIPTLPRADALG